MEEAVKVFGLEAINASNGWAISVVGITIVFTGLVTLSLAISQLHKVLDLWENPDKIKRFFSRGAKKGDPDGKSVDQPTLTRGDLTAEHREVIKQYALLARTQEDHFSLSRLLHLARISGLKDPCQNLNRLYQTRVVLPDGNGFFTWNKDAFDKLV